MSETLARPTADISDEVRATIAERVSTQPGAITPEELDAAMQQGWDYGLTLVNGFKPTSDVLGQLARQICGIKPAEAIGTHHFVPVMTAIDASARAAKATLPRESHESPTSEELPAAI